MDLSLTAGVLEVASVGGAAASTAGGGAGPTWSYNRPILTLILTPIPQESVCGYGYNIIVGRFSIIVGRFYVQLADFLY